MSAVQVAVTRKQLVGTSQKRMEDPKFVSGSGRYIDDIKLPGMLYAAFVRSPHAHARVLKIDASKALKQPGVKAVLTNDELKGIKNMPTVEDEPETVATPRPVLASKEVNYAGEAVALLLAESKYAAEDALELVEVEYEPLDPVHDLEAAMKAESAKVHDYAPSNLSYHFVYENGDLEGAFRQADEVVKVDLVNQRIHPLPLEPRGVIASYDSGNDLLTIWLSTQDPHGMRNSIADVLNVPAAKVRLIAPDVGGGFGCKGSMYPEDVAVSYASMHVGRPVKWVESRRENLLTTIHGRGQKQHAELAVRRDGRILGLKIKIVSDAGAYTTGLNVEIPKLTYKMGTGVYDIGAYMAEIFSIFTNEVPQEAYRGAGRPEAAYLIERSMNIVARKLRLDPVKIRQVNFIAKDKFPFRTPSGYTYDSGDYHGNLQKALEVSSYERLKAEQREARELGRLVGIGLVTWVEVCGFAPGFGQTAAITVTKTGDVIITASVTAGSRSAPLTGSAVLLSARKVRDKMSKIAAHKLGLKDAKLAFEGGKIFPNGDGGKGLTFEKVADLAYDGEKIPPGMEPTLFEYTAFSPANYTFPFGTHIAMVEVEKETGVVKILKYFATDDCGKLINPMVVEGQVHGGVVQGIGQAMIEEIVYDDNGQLLTSTLADYVIPSAESLVEIVWNRTETPTYANPLGVKGIGEAGTIAATPVIVNAVEDALSPYDVTVERMPLRSDYVRSLIKGSG
ncbi:MAG: xanthine dehydrogenase family protein molybdopterin-binding subunit [Thaumarchaeota archaeon]|nr:xanthine dehydrogenase family protein molybdopterin-binding subunit [Nitrososphaerota archaeon]